jgi:hypothetical protein
VGDLLPDFEHVGQGLTLSVKELSLHRQMCAMPEEFSVKVVGLAALEWIISISLAANCVYRTRWIKAVTGSNH